MMSLNTDKNTPVFELFKFAIIFISLTLYPFTYSFGQWQPLNGPYTGGQVNQIDSRDSTIFACTNSGLYHSIQGSSTWSRITNGLPDKPFLDIEFLGPHIFAATSGNKILRSSDNGLTWINSSVGITDTIVRTIKAIDTILFAGTSTQGLFVSYDYGVNWSHVSGVAGTFVSEIETHGTVLYVAVSGYGVYVSFDKGTTWTLPSTSLNSYAFESMAVDSARVLLTSNGDNACISFDTCKTWTNLFVSSYARAAFIHGDDLYLSTFGGPVEKSTDNGLTWSTIPLGNTENVSIYDFHYKDSIFYAGTSMGGVYSSSDSGATWAGDNFGMKGYISAISVLDSNIFAGTLGDGLYRSSDFDNSWVKCDIGLTATYIRAVTNLFGYIYVSTTAGFFISGDLGISWNLIPGNYGGGVLEVVGTRIYSGRNIYPFVHYSDNAGLTWNSTNVNTQWGCLSIAGFQNYLLAGSINSPYAYFSNNNGSSWTPISPFQITSSIKAGAFTSNYVVAGGSTIWRSNLTSNNWSQSSSGWPLNTWVECMHSKGGSNLLAGGWNGIFHSSDQGATWINFSDGLDYKRVLDIDENSGMLYIATSNGVWSRPVITNLDNDPESENAQSLNVFPNPSNSAIQVHWTSNSSFKTLYIFNEMGQKVYECDIKFLNHITVDTQRFAPGMYFIRIVGDANSIYKKLIID
ncbi:MAG: T9SS type A sorting domain-containing protein [Bacteroidetes bacterium]|nr:T9SS type A sorting domain-containing protein [Bacteroidota bacterium]